MGGEGIRRSQHPSYPVSQYTSNTPRCYQYTSQDKSPTPPSSSVHQLMYQIIYQMSDHISEVRSYIRLLIYLIWVNQMKVLHYHPPLTIPYQIYLKMKNFHEFISKLQRRIVVLANMPFDRLMSNERKWTKYRFYNICRCKNIVWLLIFHMLLWAAQWRLNNCQFTLFHWMIFQVYLPV